MTEGKGIEPGDKAPNFMLKNANPSISGDIVSFSESIMENGLIVMFTCNHCPYVKAILERIVRDTTELSQHGINTIAIMSNDPSDYPEDSFDNMILIAKKFKFSFPYVLDESQQTAKKSENIISAIGFRPVIAAPIAAPNIACSDIGVSRTLSGPN